MEQGISTQYQLLAEMDRLREMNRTITALLDNLPGMTFSKDAKTGVYLVCNQAFAEYAHKERPNGVIGLTDGDIFDPVTAARFAEDDQKALAMEKPYIFFEDVPDAVGRQRQFQTTKTKYVDSSGRLCLFGMCQDVTDVVRVQRENAATRAAYEEARSNGIIYAHLAHALARGYTDLYYVNMDSDAFIEFHTDDQSGVLSEARRGNDFFEGCERDAKLYVHREDQAAFVAAMDRNFLSNVLDQVKVFELVYRRIKGGNPFYVQMKVSRMEDDKRFVVIAVSDIDELIRQRRAEKRIQEERLIYARLHALTGNFLCVYVVDPETERYWEFSATNDYVAHFAQAKEGENFFGKVRAASMTFNYPKDRNRFLDAFTRENVLKQVGQGGVFTLGYRVLMNGKPLHIQMKAAMVEEREGPRLIVGLNDIDAQVRQEEDYSRRLAEAQTQANLDTMTGVKNKHAFLEMEAHMDRKIAEGCQAPFAIAIFDVNDLKRVNDTQGHQAGDQYIREASQIIREVFQNCPVFRIGGDEFAVVCQGKEYSFSETLLEKMGRRNREAVGTGGIVIACGLAKFESDLCVATVFDRADHRMYENKNTLKQQSELVQNPRPC